jgi:hypothetical protein
MPIPEQCRALADVDVHHIMGHYILSEAQTRAIIKGNQGGGTLAAAYDATMRVLGLHPVKKRNVLNKPIRFISKVLPKSEGDEENQQYVEFKKLLPYELIKKDVTARSSIMTVQRPGGEKLKVEFMSSKQDIDAFMSVQRSVVYQDEEIDKIKYDENQMRLLKEGGDTTICLTPVKGLDWTFDRIWKRASRVYRSKTIQKKYGFPFTEEPNPGSGIEVFCWATDDNPVMDEATIERIFSDIDDPDELAMRRYGVFRQVSGRIYKSFDKKVHVVPYDKVFDPSLFRSYWHFRLIDFHPQKPWYCNWVAANSKHEWFVWQEFKASHDQCTSFDLRDQIISKSLVDEDSFLNRVTLIDPLAKVKQGNTGFSVFEDITIGEEGLRRVTPADTKNEQGRMNIRIRLKNSLRCGVPGNNRTRNTTDPRYGEFLPTIWFLDSCPETINHFMNWRYVDWKQEGIKAVRDTKKVSEKYSDYCRNLEFLGALNPVWYTVPESDYDGKSWFRRAA